ncbi:MAG TPA: endonuclease/exonuclease/phosphatase family protein [Pirellulales bacterium]|nr:endonuclease/exonuclease/phosphatase family protein [Pirellulales bacterium]
MEQTPNRRALGKIALSLTFCARAAWLASAVLSVAISACYARRCDACAAVTVFPVWVWTLAGAGLIAAAWRCVGRRWTIPVALAWSLVLVVFSDHPFSVLRFAERRSERTLRVVSINCSSNSKALHEVVALRPDIVLVQESPGREPLLALARELFGEKGEALWAVDASIIAKGEISRVRLPQSVASYALCARTTLTDYGEVEVVSLRLEPGLVRIDLWSPDCWHQQTANRQRRRRQLNAIAGSLQSPLPLIVGGDFNAPPGDAVYDALQPQLRDAFSEAGRGWGNTIINELPFLRIDQVWHSSHWQACDVYSRRTEHSDHRMVICDVMLRAPDSQ